MINYKYYCKKYKKNSEEKERHLENEIDDKKNSLYKNIINKWCPTLLLPSTIIQNRNYLLNIKQKAPENYNKSK